MAKGIIIFTAFSFVCGATIFSLMLYILIKEEQLQHPKDQNPTVGKVSSHYLPHAFGLHLDKTSIDLIVTFVLLMSLMKMIFSVLLIIGIKKNKPSFVVAYFSFGSLLCLLLLVTAVLELVQFIWQTAIITAIYTFIMMERLSVIYSVYENMTKDSDAHLLLDEVEFNGPEPFNNNISA